MAIISSKAKADGVFLEKEDQTIYTIDVRNLRRDTALSPDGWSNEGETQNAKVYLLQEIK
jgi:hypothetical protein